MDLLTRAQNGFWIVEIHDDIRMGMRIAEVKNTVNTLIEKKGAVNIALSFTPMSELDSEAVSVVVACIRLVARVKGHFVLVHPGPEIVEVLQIIGLLDMVTVCSKVEELPVVGA